MQILAQLVKARGAEDLHAGHLPEVADVEHPLMRVAVLADNAAAVDSQHDMELLQSNVMQQHIIGTLQKRGVYRRDRLHPLLGKPGGHADRMALGNADVKEPGRKLGRKLVKSRAVLHGGGNGADGLVAGGHPAKLLSKNIRKGRDGYSLTQTRLGVKLPDTMELLRRFFCRRIATPLLRDEMDEDRLMQRDSRLQQHFNSGNVMPVYRAKVGKPQILKQRRAENAAAHVLFDLMGQCIEPTAESTFGRCLSVP